MAAGALLFVFLRTFLQAPPPAAAAPMVQGGTAELGKLLFKDYLLPFEIVSIILLVAMVGAILLSKKDLK
ncbi:MAG TPA: NADH-quinone oxidoreductase subunit J, partial [Verrucomicrobiae bacterium]